MNSMVMVGSVLARVLLLRIIPTFFRNLELVFADGVQKTAGEKAKSLQAAGDGKVILVNGEAPKTVELASIQQILKPKPVVEGLVWKGSIDAALDYRRVENDTDDYGIDFKTTARHGRWRHTAEGE
jgi:hypothetical protein